MSFLQLVRIWIVISVLATVAGWLLSALGQLNGSGYLIFFGTTGGMLLLSRKRLGWGLPRRAFRWKRIRWRFRRALPGCFAALAFLVFLGGALYPPSTHTAMTYRTPRVLHWLAEGQWYWVSTMEQRINNRACGFEWLSAPLLLFTRSDRGLFLLNYIPFLLLPGLIFSVFTRLGVRPRVAWQWMWLLPTGYTFLAQAESAGNDTFPTVYALATVDFACRAWAKVRSAKSEALTMSPSPQASPHRMGRGRSEERGTVTSDLTYSLLAAALLTGAKASNIPLLLAWGILVFPLLPRLLLRPAMTTCVVALAALVSFLPTAILNQFYCGDWSGLVLEAEVMNMKHPVIGIWGNGFLLLLNNFVPTFFPQASWWNRSALQVLPHWMSAQLAANFDKGFEELWELPSEDWSGIGFGLSVLIAVSVVAALRARPKVTAASPSGLAVPVWLRRGALVASWVALLVYCMKSGMATAARLISPYYPMVLPLLLIGAGHVQVVRRRWWRGMVWGSLGLAFLVVVLMPGRPLWPARTVLSGMLSALSGTGPFSPQFSSELHVRANPGASGESMGGVFDSWESPGMQGGRPGGGAGGSNAVASASEHGMVARALKVYTVYGERHDPTANVRELLPKGLSLVGFVGGPDEVAISLWRPFGQRRVEPILLYDAAAGIRQRHIEYAVVSGDWLAKMGWGLGPYLRQVQAEVVAAAPAIIRASGEAQAWYVVRFRAPEPHQ